MRVSEWDSLEEQITLAVVVGHEPFAAAIASVCKKNKSKPVNALLLASVSFAYAIDSFDVSDTQNRVANSLSRFQLVAALAADVAALHGGQTTCGDLCDFWHLTDDCVFLDN